ncbi:MAG: 2-isopropylmalate synthase, partial [Gammaproteobacteria bacterium]|nr:2-isopropylmalate synthase [Gammaproteobacteria bacterium]
VQAYAEQSESEVSSSVIHDIFRATYLEVDRPIRVADYRASRKQGSDRLTASLVTPEANIEIAGTGRGVLDAFVGAINDHLDSRLVLVDYSEHTLGDNEQSEAMAYVQLSIAGQRFCGAGCSHDIVGASMQAVLNAISRSGRRLSTGVQKVGLQAV